MEVDDELLDAWIEAVQKTIELRDYRDPKKRKEIRKLLKKIVQQFLTTHVKKIKKEVIL